MVERTKIMSVTVHDCEVQTFRSGGKGGQNQNKRDTGVRIIHHPSGARGESREQRSQLQNKRSAWHKMAESPQFNLWLRRTLGHYMVEESTFQVDPTEVMIEVRRGGTWTQVREEELLSW